MEIWIRSQDKIHFINVNHLWCGDKDIICDFNYNEGTNVTYQILGKYKSNARALEILEDIQYALENSLKRTIAYKMPIE